ncbi:DUF2062 domain-containing protein [Paracidovorax sp. MALMAid1276]
MARCIAWQGRTASRWRLCTTTANDRMKQRLLGLMPSPEALRSNRWLRWLGPALQHPRLWHMSRRGIALGMALGVFFGLLIPIAQIPFAAGAAVALRANVPAAVASTLVTNPVTFGPVYYAAWRLGRTLLGEPVKPGEEPPMPEDAVAEAPERSWWETLVLRIRSVGKPLMLGLAVVATGVGLLTYLLVTWVWFAKVKWSRRRRLAGKGAEHV